jgi:hypothetical protein
VSNYYFLTFRFEELGTTEEIALKRMRKEIEQFYAVLLPNVVRRLPQRGTPWVNLPQLIAMPDRPVASRVNTNGLAYTGPNHGLHYHAIVTIPKSSRLQEGLVEHIQHNKRRYCGKQGCLIKIKVRPILDCKRRSVDYTVKHIKRRTFSPDDILDLPRRRS